MQTEIIDAELKYMYIPELSVKTRRGCALSGFSDLYSLAELTQVQNRQYLLDLSCKKSSHELLDDLFLIHFLSQHYAQHIETSLYVLTQRALNKNPSNHTAEPLQAQPLRLDATTVRAGEYLIGSNGSELVYDNERPCFTYTLNTFNISKRPVTNGEYLKFMQEDGYKNPDFWDEPGWQWQQESSNSRPDTGGRTMPDSGTGWVYRAHIP